VPSRLLLLGGGAAMRNLPEYLGVRLGLAVHPWRLSPNDTGEVVDDALFATAAALSAVAWEEQPCT
jgi:hypothetical protein